MNVLIKKYTEKNKAIYVHIFDYYHEQMLVFFTFNFVIHILMHPNNDEYNFKYYEHFEMNNNV